MTGVTSQLSEQPKEVNFFCFFFNDGGKTMVLIISFGGFPFKIVWGRNMFQ